MHSYSPPFVLHAPHKFDYYWWESQKERDRWEDQDVGRWTILKWILERYDGMEWIGSIWLRIGTSGGFL
jgi:hypothetical protein